MTTGQINVQAENIFPIIKKFLYSDHEIFLREIVSNAVDASLKLRTLAKLGESTAATDNLRVEVIVDKKAKTITVKDNGIGMTADEIEKYINQVAFSGAEEFLKKYEGKTEGIIGHFGLGFYSAFMVSKKVEINTLSHKEKSKAVKWECDGSPNYTLEESTKKEFGTEIIMHIAEDSEEFLEDNRIEGILSKYCKFLPIEIKFGTKTEYIDHPEGKTDKDGKVERVEQTVDNIINNPSPAWTKKPVDLSHEDYQSFYSELYPMSFEKPLFHIHLNVDYPFNLTGILFFPKLNKKMEMQRNKIHLYSNQVFITDQVENIVPDFLTLLHGVIDSPDIPLNVSRSYLQADGNVKKISSHITKKVADKLTEMFNKDRADFESKWEDIKMFMEYGMLTDEKFYEKIKSIFLVRNTEEKYFTLEEYQEHIKENQQDKNEKLVCLYASNKEEQHSFINAAKAKNYDVLVLDTPLTSHLLQQLEMKEEKISFTRVDADTADKLIDKGQDLKSNLSEDQEKELTQVLESLVKKEQYSIKFESLSENEQPVIITRPEFMRRMKEQQEVGGNNFGMGNFPDMYNLVVNANHKLISKVLVEADEEKKKNLTKQAVDLALLSQNMLKGEALTQFINRSITLIN